MTSSNVCRNTFDGVINAYGCFGNDGLLQQPQQPLIRPMCSDDTGYHQAQHPFSTYNSNIATGSSDVIDSTHVHQRSNFHHVGSPVTDNISEGSSVTSSSHLLHQFGGSGGVEGIMGIDAASLMMSDLGSLLASYQAL